MKWFFKKKNSVLFIIWKFHIMHPDHFPVLPDPSSTLVTFPKTNEEEEKKKYQVQFVLPIFSAGRGQTCCGQPLKEIEFFPPRQKPSTVKSYMRSDIL